MSHSGRRIGLSDTRFDPELESNEIDHDFFDNPCGSPNSEDSLEADPRGAAMTKIEGLVGAPTNENSVPTEGITESYCPAPRFRLNLDMTAPRPQIDDDLVTPETCVPNANLKFFPPQYRNSISTERQTASYFSSGVQGFESGPHSSYLMTADFRTTEENFDDPLIGIQESKQQPRQKLFDLSSSSSDGDAESEVGSGGRVLDTDDDEEFVELLEKYYDYIDLGDTNETSDLTEVSPMSSFSESPHPSFCPSDIQQLPADHADPVYKTDDKLRPLDGIGRSTKLPLTKPLPPLIIHTLEEVPIIRPRPAIFAKGFVTSKTNESFTESLLMKVKEEIGNPNESVVISKGFADPDLIVGVKPAFSMSTSNSSSSFQCKSEHNSQSSISVPSFDSFPNKLPHQGNQEGCEEIANEKHHSHEKFGRKSTESIKSNHCNQLTHVKGSIHHHRFGYHHHQPVKASATIARQRQQRRIEHENSILVRRLQNVKPSKEIVEAFRSGTNNLKCTF